MKLYCYILIFNNTYNAMKCESELKKADVSNIIMPTPTNITQSCGLSIKIKPEDAENAAKVIHDDKITVKAIYRKDNNRFELINMNEVTEWK